MADELSLDLEVMFSLPLNNALGRRESRRRECGVGGQEEVCWKGRQGERKIQRDRMAGCAFKELQRLWEGEEQGEGGNGVKQDARKVTRQK